MCGLIGYAIDSSKLRCDRSKLISAARDFIRMSMLLGIVDHNLLTDERSIRRNLIGQTLAFARMCRIADGEDQHRNSRSAEASAIELLLVTVNQNWKNGLPVNRVASRSPGTNANFNAAIAERRQYNAPSEGLDGNCSVNSRLRCRNAIH